MEKRTIAPRSVAFGLALAAAGILNSIIVVLKERNAAVMDAMKKVTGHHWTTHSLIVILVFLGLGASLALAKRRRGIEMSAGRLIGIVVSSVAVAALIIVGFYLFGD